MQLLVELQKHPELFASVFTCAGEKPLTAGNKYKLYVRTYMSVLSVMHFRNCFGTIYYQILQ